MSLFDLTLLLVCTLVIILFWQSRGSAEAAVKHVTRYCESNQLQLISVSLVTRKFAIVQGKLGWHSEYQFEFSGNKEDKYCGTILLLNKHAKHIDVPAYRVE